jgi:hypothetical protein
MNGPSVAPRSWGGRRWWFAVAFVFVLQLGLIFALSDKRINQPRQVISAPSLHVARSAAADLLVLNDPTLFALPHRYGFAGLAWLAAPQPESRSFEWPEDPRFLQLSTQSLGAVFGCALETDNLSSPVSPGRPEPRLTMADPGPLPAQAESRLRLEGGLAGRKLVTPIQLPLERHTDLLAPSVVQMVVGSEGWPVSVPVLLSGSGSGEADAAALRLARTARFNSVASGGPGKPANSVEHLTWGRMVFEWRTLPQLTTNAVSTRP